MSGYTDEFSIGNLEIPSNIFYAPLAGCSDYPLRKMAAKYKPGLIFCEMVKIEAVWYRDNGTLDLLHFDPSMHPIGAQVCGSHSDKAADVAKFIEDKGFDILDLNCGCPVDKVVKDGSGSGLLKNVEKIGEMVYALKKAVSIPVTIKTRIGWDESSICIEKVLQTAKEAGAAAVTIHGRTRKQGYRGEADWDIIKRCKEQFPDMVIIANGDIFSAEAAKKCFEHTRCDGVMVARGMLGQPWIAEDIRLLYENGSQNEKTEKDVLEVLLDHFSEILSFQKNEVYALFDMRRVGCWYLKSFPGIKATRVAINEAKSALEAKSIIEERLKAL